jgi:two-component system sensor histidine kinase ResE
MAGSFNAMATQVSAARQAQRNLVANVSHDLKTPLTAIRGWSQALLDGTATNPEQRQRAAAVIHEEVGRMERLVGQLLDLARIESGQLVLNRQPVELPELLDGLYRSLVLHAEERQITLTRDLQVVPPVSGDPDRLAQIVTNLLDNALTHTPAGGRVHLSLRPHGPEAVEIAVQDTGMGIPAAELERIFDRFYQVDKSRARLDEQSGSGLGLAIVKELVEAHGGQIVARSQVGQGTIFTVRLPVSRDPAGPTRTGQG